MLQRFKQYIRDEHLFPEGGQVLLAVSGGRDSVVLAHLVHSAGIPFAIAHCNFHLRLGDCDRDETFVRNLAVSYGVPCYVAQFDTLRYAADNHLSVEEAARNLRYDFFEKTRIEHNLSVIATAHHRDDAIETFFINLLRGTGIAGLHGIPLRNGHIVRPMLTFSREEINDYICRHGLEYVEDCTNSQPLYLRNRIRLQLMPLLRSLSPSFDTTMQSNMQHLADASEIYRSAVKGVCAGLLQPIGNGFKVEIARLRALQPLETYVYELLYPFGFSAPLAAEITDSLDAQSGTQFLSPSHRLIKDRTELIIMPLKEPGIEEYIISDTASCATLPLPLAMRLTKRSECSSTIRLQPYEAWFDSERVRFPLLLRHWRAGDRFQPFGMKGSRLVSDLFSDLKVSLPEKENVWLLCDADEKILWVVGYRASAMASITATTKDVLQMRLASK